MAATAEAPPAQVAASAAATATKEQQQQQASPSASRSEAQPVPVVTSLSAVYPDGKKKKCRAFFMSARVFFLFSCLRAIDINVAYTFACLIFGGLDSVEE